MLTMSTFREERRLLSLELAGGARMVAYTAATMKRELRSMQIDLAQFAQKQHTLRINVNDKATIVIRQIKDQVKELDGWGKTIKLVENVDKALDSAKKLVQDFNTAVSISIGSDLSGLEKEMREAFKERALYAAKGNAQDMQYFDRMTKEIVAINPYLQSPDAMKLISQSEQLQLHPEQREVFVEQAAQLGVTTSVAPKELLSMMGAMSQATGVRDAESLANSIQYMSNHMKEFNSKQLEILISYSQQFGTELNSPEKLAAFAVDMDRMKIAGDKTGPSEALMRQAAQRVSTQSDQQLIGRDYAKTSYANAMDANPYLEYMQAQKKARQAVMDFGMTVARDVLPVMKLLANGMTWLAETLNGMPRWGIITAEIFAGVTFLAITAYKLLRFVSTMVEMTRNLSEVFHRKPGSRTGSPPVYPDTIWGEKKRDNKGGKTKQGSSRLGSNPFGRFLVEASLILKMLGKPKTKPIPTPNPKYVQEYRMPSGGQSLQRNVIPKKTREVRSVPSSPKPSNIHSFSMPTHTPSMTPSIPSNNLSNLKLSGGGSFFRRFPFLRTLMGATDIAQSDNKLKTAARVGTEALGAWGGGTAGATMGAMAGSIVPIVGTVAGGVIGSAIGAYYGAEYGGKLFDMVDEWWNKEPQPTQTPEPVTAPVPLGPPAPASSPASNPLQQAGSISVTIPQITVPLHAEGVLQDIPTMLNMLNDPSVGQRIKTIIEKALLDALETRGGVAT